MVDVLQVVGVNRELVASKAKEKPLLPLESALQSIAGR